LRTCVSQVPITASCSPKCKCLQVIVKCALVR
jgi:hypothetical protein